MTHEEDHDLLIEINSDVKHIKDKLAEIGSRKNLCDREFVKKNEFKPIQTAYYVASRTLIVALISGLCMVGVYAAKLF